MRLLRPLEDVLFFVLDGAPLFLAGFLLGGLGDWTRGKEADASAGREDVGGDGEGGAGGSGSRHLRWAGPYIISKRANWAGNWLSGQPITRPRGMLGAGGQLA